MSKLKLEDPFEVDSSDEESAVDFKAFADSESWEEQARENQRRVDEGKANLQRWLAEEKKRTQERMDKLRAEQSNFVEVVRLDQWQKGLYAGLQGMTNEGPSFSPPSAEMMSPPVQQVKKPCSQVTQPSSFFQPPKVVEKKENRSSELMLDAGKYFLFALGCFGLTALSLYCSLDPEVGGFFLACCGLCSYLCYLSVKELICGEEILPASPVFSG